MGRATLLATVVLAFGLAVAPAASARSRPIFRVAGNGVLCPNSTPDCGDLGPATNAPIAYPQGAAIDKAGDVFVVDWGTNQIREVSPRGVIKVVAGDTTSCASAQDCGDGGPASSAQLSAPTAVAVDSRGNLYIADPGDDEIRMVSPKGIITRFAGTGTDCVDVSACGDGGPATSAQLTSPDGVAVDKSGNVYIADTGDNEIRKVSSAGTISRVAGNGAQCAAAPACGDGLSATSGELNYPEAIAVDGSGHLFIADNGDNEIREVAKGKMQRLAGTGTPCAAAPSCGDGGPATSAALYLPEGVAVDSRGSVYVADWGDNEVRVVSKAGTISRFAGNGNQCATAPGCGDFGAATSAMLSSPQSVAVDPAGNVYISDTYDNELRFVPGPTSALSSAKSGSTTVWLDGLATAVAGKTVSLRYVLTARARVSVSVRQGNGTTRLVTHQSVDAGLGEAVWNRHLGSKKAPHGRYTLTVSVTVGHSTISSSLSFKL